MNNKEQYYKWVEMGIIKDQTPEQRVEFLSNELLKVLYTPCEDSSLFVPDFEKIEKLGIDSGEPVNWMDLKANIELIDKLDVNDFDLREIVKSKRNVFIITIDEASPGACPTLCAYIEKYLTIWGWDNIIVETEW
jgi:hypothetical protein